jgi:signal transduction histidine kinase
VSWKKAEKLPAVKADSRLLAETVNALAANALEAMPDGGKLEIETSVDAEGRSVVAKFRDFGKGISENHIRKVFQPYFTSKKGHKGLGLSVCKRVMELVRGTIDLTSVKGEGTTVILTFPIAGAETASSPQKEV